jgi:hypothetical protein
LIVGEEGSAVSAVGVVSVCDTKKADFLVYYFNKLFSLQITTENIIISSRIYDLNNKCIGEEGSAVSVV